MLARVQTQDLSLFVHASWGQDEIAIPARFVKGHRGPLGSWLKDPNLDHVWEKSDMEEELCTQRRPRSHQPPMETDVLHREGLAFKCSLNSPSYFPCTEGVWVQPQRVLLEKAVG